DHRGRSRPRSASRQVRRQHYRVRSLIAPTIATETGVALPSADIGTDKGKSRAAAGLRSIVLPLGLAFVVLSVWQLYVTVWNIPAVILPSPISIGRYIVARYDILLMHA